MRKDARKTTAVNIANVQRYHGGDFRTQNYAFAGFKSNKYFTSDRYEQLTVDFQRLNGKPLCGFGLEIETECSTITDETVLAEVFDKIIFPLFPADLYKMQRDGSLGGETSVECITQVMTKLFIRNHYKDFRAMFDKYFPALGISADAYDTNCGMHVNISNAVFGRTPEQQREAIRKLFYIINRHYDVFRTAFRRPIGKTVWCEQMDYTEARTMNLDDQPNDHHKCLNLSHLRAGRIEIRLPGGQSTFSDFRGTMETVFFITERVRTLKWEDCNDLYKIFRGCNQYVFGAINSELSANLYGRLFEAMKSENLDDQ